MTTRAKRTKSIAAQSLGEAHLYVAVAKADGIVSAGETTYAQYYAGTAQKWYDLLKINSVLEKKVKADIRAILAAPEYRGWPADRHLDEAVTQFTRARSLGNWSVAMAPLKHESGLLETAQLDGYVFKESRFLKKIHKRLEAEFGGKSRRESPGKKGST